jgi:gliding motility-associated-like protein
LKGKDEIKDLFSDKLGSYEAKVNPELWGSIASQVGTSGAAASGGVSLLTKLIIGLSAASVITISSVYLFNSTEEDKKVAVVKDSQNSDIETHTTPVKEDNSKEQEIYVNPVQQVENIEEQNPIETPETEFVLPIEEDRLHIEDNPITELIEEEVETEVVEEGAIATETEEQVVEEEEEVVEEVVEETQKEVVEFNLPNIFSPNGDRNNDELFITSKGIESLSISVYDQNGNVVYQSNDVNFKWDGRNIYSGELVSEGIHMYVLNMVDINGETHKKSQNLMVLFR